MGKLSAVYYTFSNTAFFENLTVETRGKIDQWVKKLISQSFFKNLLWFENFDPSHTRFLMGNDILKIREG